MSLTPFYPVMPLYDPSYPHFLPWSCREPEADSWISLPLLILYAFLGFICFRCCLIPSAGVTASAHALKHVAHLDIVHLRLFFCVVENNNPLPPLDFCLKLLSKKLRLPLSRRLSF